jgi:hypothetical protein
VGRPRLNIDPEQVKELARIGCTKTEAAIMLGCSVDTLDRRFAECFQLGDAQGKIQLRRSQHRRATEAESDTMLIHLGMDRLGQKAKADVTSGGQAIFQSFDDSRDPDLPPPAEAAPVREDAG